VALGERLRRVAPPSPLATALAVRSGLYAVGTGVFIAGNAVFFTEVVGLSAAQVGLGVSISGVVAFLVSVPAGRYADRVGPLRMWLASSIGEALVYLVYPWVRGLGGFVVVMVLLALLQALGSAGRSGYTLTVIPRGERVRTLAFVRSALNIGFTIGALLAGAALATGDIRIVQAVPLATGAVLLVNAALLDRLPRVRDRRAAVPLAPREPTGAALRNLPFVALGGLNGMLFVDQVLLSVVLPLWLVERTDAPHAALAWMYGTNTVLVVLLQVVAARGSETVSGAVRAGRLAGLFAFTACTLAMWSHWTHGSATLAVLWLAYVGVTGAELFHSAANWGLLAELSDPSRRAEYQGAWRLGQQLQQIVGPAVFTWLAVSWRPEGFLVIGAVALLASLALPAVAQRAQVRLAQLEKDRAVAGKPVSLPAQRVDTIAGSGSRAEEQIPCPTYSSSSPPKPAPPSGR
jgi:MFS family permease